MKNKAAVLFALMIGFSYYSSVSVAEAAGNEGQIIESEEEIKEENGETEKDKEKSSEKEETFLNNWLDSFFNKAGETKDQAEDSSKNGQKTEDKKSSGREAKGLKNLQIPQKLDVVIDPWEVDNKGQIYSEQYIISNTGETAGVLTLSGLTCRPQEHSGVVVRTDKEGIHDSGDKVIYMEMLLGNGEKIVFSQENSQYQTKLEPGEELSICFAGEANENAFGEWKNDDISVSMVYSWETEDEAEDTALKDLEEKPQDDAGDAVEEEKDIKKDVNNEEDRERKKSDSDSKESEEKIKPDSDSEESKDKVKSDPDSEESKDKVKSDPDSEESKDKAKSDSDSEGSEEKPKTNSDLEKTETETDDTQSEDRITDKNVSEKDTPMDANNNTVQDVSSNGSAGEVQEAEKPVADESVSAEGITGGSGDGAAETPGSEINSESADQEKDEIKNIDLSEPQKVDVVIDSWELDEKGRLVSPQYLLQNTGNTAGIWDLSELICKPKEQSTVAVITDKGRLHDSGENAVYMELIPGNGEKIALSQEKSEYKVELKPGEQLLVRFVGEINGNLFETHEEGDIEVTAVCTWNLQ